EPTPRRKMAVASNRPAAQPAAVRRASVEPAAQMPDFNQEQELHAYRHMLLIRRFEEKAGQLYGMGLIGGFCTSISVRRAWPSACKWRSRRATRSSPDTATTVICWRAAWTPRA